MKPGQPSQTAIRIAVSAVAASYDAELAPFVSDEDVRWSEAFVRAHSPEAVRHLAMWQHEQTRPFAQKLSESMEPGGPLFILLRKRFIEEQVRAALDGGTCQLVGLGAGYDTLPLRLLPRFPGLRCFEVDHPPTQEVKRRALAEAGPPDGLTLLPVDMAKSSCEGPLLQAGCDPSLPSVFVAEGVLMYLDAAEVDALFAVVRRLGKGGLRFVFTVMDRKLLSQRGSGPHKTAQFLRLSGEPLRSSHDLTALEGWLVERGFALLATADAGRLRALYLEPRGLEHALGEGEVIVVAEAK